MKRFYTESGILVCEWKEFVHSLLLGKHGFKFTPEQWKNRTIGRTKVKPNERIAMMKVLEKIRAEKQREGEITTTVQTVKVKVIRP